MGKDSQRIALSKRFAVYFLAFLSYQLIYAGRDWPSYLSGHLDLTASPWLVKRRHLDLDWNLI